MFVKKILKIYELLLDIYEQLMYNINCKARVIRVALGLPDKKGSEDLKGMSARQTRRLIEWLKLFGLTDTQIVECLEYINK